MIRKKRRRSRGRPYGPSPRFLDDCVRLDATTLLAKARGARFTADKTPCGDLRGQWTLQWTEGSRPRWRAVTLLITATPQPFGGVRHWWRCPACSTRRGTLFVVDEASPVACRQCLGLSYLSDYSGRARRRRLVGLMRGLALGVLDAEAEQELDLLLARRRRGVRRGRRVLLRAARALGRLRGRCSQMRGICEMGGL